MYYLMSFYLMLLSKLYFLLGCYFLLFKMNILVSWNLIKFMGFKFEFVFFFDWVMFIFFSVVSLISSMVFLYSLEYMKGTLFLNRFMMLIMIFIISMKLMIISPNMFSILLGWDGLGISSYCLIIFYQNKKSFNSGFVTILMNRVGDIGVLLMIGLLLSSNYLSILFLWDLNYKYMYFVMLAAITKSAQIPFSSWLPLAMAAPTPVSSLVHSSTLVTAGVYLLIRFSYILSNYLMYVLMVISCWTMFMASVSAVFEFDLKKIIALSTLSQLGLMILSVSVGLINLSFFHLITHAMFKSLLFLCSGIIIHNYFNNQDIRFISFININIPLVSMIFSVASFALCGMPFLSGFYSKDLLIEFYNMGLMNNLIFNMMYISMMNTVIYSIRLVTYITIKPLILSNCVNYDMFNMMNYSIYILFMLTIFYGSMMNWLVFNSLNLIILSMSKKILVYKLMLLGMVLGWGDYFVNIYVKLKTYIFFSSMWLFQLMGKKSKIMLFSMNNKMIMLKELGWIEYLSGKELIFYMINMTKMEDLKSLKYSVLIISVSYVIFIVFYI